MDLVKDLALFAAQRAFSETLRARTCSCTSSFSTCCAQAGVLPDKLPDSAVSSAAVQAAQNTDVAIDINIATAGGGFYLKGVVGAHVPLRCDRCCCTFTTPVSAKFEVGRSSHCC